MKKGRVGGREWPGGGGREWPGGKGVAGGVNTFMHWRFTSACMQYIATL